jgi:uncharacterized spore protein YtfJ
MNSVADKLNEPIEQMLERMSVKSVFGDPTGDEEATIIPVASILYGFGYGFGGDGGEMEGGGGGGGGKAVPRGYVQVGPDGVGYESIDNDTLIALAGIFTGIWSIFWIALSVMTMAKAVASVRTAALRETDDSSPNLEL